jgi:hypothetical protein
MTFAAAQSAAVFRESQEQRCAWTVEDDHGFPTFTNPYDK